MSPYASQASLPSAAPAACQLAMQRVALPHHSKVPRYKEVRWKETEEGTAVLRCIRWVQGVGA